MSAFLPYQEAWYADKAKVRVMEKSRRVGVTWAEAARQVLLASRSRSSGGMDCAYVTTSARLGRVYIEACSRWCESLGVAAASMGVGMVDEVLSHEIVFKSGYRIRALTSNPEAMRGLGGDVVIDEAAHHADLVELLKAARAMTDWGGRLTIISTHNGVDNPFNLLCEEVKAQKRAASIHRVTIHDALSDGLYRRRCLVQGIEWTADGEAQWLKEALESWGSDEEYLVIPSRSGGAYIRRDLIEECSSPAPIERLELPADHIHKAEVERTSYIARWCQVHLDHHLKTLPGDRVTTVGVDFARSGTGDLSVVTLLTEQRDLKKACPLMLELRGVPYEEQWQILRYICDRIVKSGRWGGVALDSGLNGGWLAEKALAHYGQSQVDCVQITSHWYGEHLPRFRAAFEEHMIVVPRDVDVRDDILQIELRNGMCRVELSAWLDRVSGQARTGE